MNNPKSDGRLSKSEIEYLLRALRANLKAAKTTILGLEPKLRAAFEEELNRNFPLRSDPVWQEAMDSLMTQYNQSQTKVDQRCDELGIPRRFRPAICPPGWRNGGLQMVKEMRAEMRRLAYMQLKTMVAERAEEQDREAARVQLEILAHGMITPTAQAFFDRLPKVDDLIKPISASEVYRLLEGAPQREHQLYDWDKKKLPEYQPDLGKGERED